MLPWKMSDDADDEDEKLLLPAELGAKVGASKALIQYAIDAGCPTVHGRLSNSTFIRWMLDNYAAFRQLAGLPSLPPLERGSPQQVAQKKISNMLITITEFMSSRASDPDTKKAAAEVSKFLKGRPISE